MKNIPNICHLMWDKSPMAYLQVLTVISFHRLNPDWRIIIWIPKQDVSDLGSNTYVPDYTGPDYFGMITSMDYVEIIEVDLNDYGIRTDVHFILCSDQLRLRMLYSMGGVYTDFDVIWIRPMESLAGMDCIGNPEDFEASICYHEDTRGWSNIAILIAEKESLYILELIEAQKKIKPPYSHQIYGTDLIDSLYPTFEKVEAKYPRILGVRYKTFYPYDINNLRMLYKEDKLDMILNDNVLCLHWFNGHARSKKYINDEDYNRPCSITSVLNYLKLNKGQL